MNKKLSVLLGAVLLASSPALYATTVAGTDPNTQQMATKTATDTEISNKIKAAIENNEVTQNTHVKFSVHNGVVMLNGTANNSPEADTLITIAQSTRGVAQVNTDNLKVKDSTQPFTDSYITAKVKGMLMQNQLMGDDVKVPALDISVNTQDGRVILTGTVENSQQLKKAEKLAKSIKGVKDVKSSLKIEGPGTDAR